MSWPCTSASMSRLLALVISGMVRAAASRRSCCHDLSGGSACVVDGDLCRPPVRRIAVDARQLAEQRRSVDQCGRRHGHVVEQPRRAPASPSTGRRISHCAGVSSPSIEASPSRWSSTAVHMTSSMPASRYGSSTRTTFSPARSPPQEDSVTDPNLGVLLFIPSPPHGAAHSPRRARGRPPHNVGSGANGPAGRRRGLASDPTRRVPAGVGTKPTTLYLVDQLREGGYVQRVADPTDARARLIRFTSKGRAVIALARAAQLEVEQESPAILGAKRTDALVDTLARLRSITDPYLEVAPSAEAALTGAPTRPTRSR